MAEFASRGVANTGLGFGIAGTALSLLNGGLGNVLGAATCSENTAASRFELEQAQKIAQKDMEIAYWRGQDETNRKITDSYANLESQVKELAKEVRANKDEQTGINLQQAVYNGTNTAAMGCIKDQIAQLYSLTKLVVPNGSVCPGWGAVETKPASSATTTT